MPEAVGSRVRLVTGASRGSGCEVARQRLALGDVVDLGMRDVADMGELSSDFGDHARALPLDITSASDIGEAARSIDAACGRLDALVNNAAIGYDSVNRGTDVDLHFVRPRIRDEFARRMGNDPNNAPIDSKEQTRSDRERLERS